MPHGPRFFYIDDLIINGDGVLVIDGWVAGLDHLLVRRDSVHLQDSLGKMLFRDYDRQNLHLEVFNRDYWEISSTPEPAAYGAVLLSVGLGFVARRRWKAIKSSPI